MNPESLRPLSFAELVDRAVTLAVRGLPTLAPIALLFAVLAGADRVISLDLKGRPWLIDVVFIVAQSIRVVFWAIACVPISEAIVGGGALAVPAYNLVARKLVGIVQLLMLEYLAVVLAALAVLMPAIGIFATVFIVEAIRGHVEARVPPGLLGAVLGLWVAGAIFLFFAIRCVGNVAILACLLEGEPVSRAVQSAIRRILRSKIRFRLILISVAYEVPIVSAALSVNALLSRFASVGNAEFCSVISTAFLGFVSLTFGPAFDTLFYYDVRVRTEAYDLQARASALASESVRA